MDLRTYVNGHDPSSSSARTKIGRLRCRITTTEMTLQETYKGAGNPIERSYLY